MSASPPAARPAIRHARIAVALLFVVNGLMLANLVPWFPIIKSDLGLSNTLFGIAIAGYPTGALVVGPIGGALIGRFGSARSAVAAGIAAALMLPLIGAAPHGVVLGLALFLTGGSDAIMDTAMNAHGLRVQRRYGRSIINSFHALWSGGAVVGGLVGSAAIGAGLSRPGHLAVVGGVAAVTLAVVLRWLLPGPEHAERTEEAGAGTSAGLLPALRAAPATILGLGLLLITGTSVEDVAGTWSGVYLDEVVGAAAGVVGLGFVSAQAMMFVGRIFGDRVVDRYGPARVARAGLAVSLAGLVVVIVGRNVPAVLLGFGMSGLGVSTVYPLAMVAAGEIPGVRSGDGLTIVTWMSRIGFLAMPPLVGLVADAVSLPAGIGVVAAMAAIGSLLAGLLRGSTPDPDVTGTPGAGATGAA